ncbi:hypothetical protein [Vulcanisaeta distributa]|uniref:hypothetical protein n=1 Tax=Vulcanisaeta distributa TaxID=164451 RepID=UPI001FB4B196|nr:hypothetical protein [Vulcanisaeta distributa]
MSNSEYTGLKELLLKQVIQQYIMNQYPWGDHNKATNTNGISYTINSVCSNGCNAHVKHDADSDAD